MRKVVFITGASSGLGMAMAREFAERGYSLVLAARRQSLLDDLSLQLKSRYGCQVLVIPLDVVDCDAVEQSLQQAQAQMGRIDIVIANAGVGITGKSGEIAFTDIKQMIDVNVMGLMATVESALRLFRAQGGGQIVGLSSVAGSRGLPSGGVYGATKSAVSTYLQAVQVETYKEPIDVTILSPGYIDTPMNQGSSSRPFLIGLDKGAKKLVDRIEQKVAHAYVPSWPWSILAPVLRCLPVRLLSAAR